jgi:hypothetical protein
MSIDPPQAPAMQTPFLEKVQDLILLSHRGHGQRLKKVHDFNTVLEIPASQLTNHERMTQYGSLLKLFREPRMSPSKVIDPDRSIDQNHQDLVLRRRTG